jgi:hypothetical protein
MALCFSKTPEMRNKRAMLSALKGNYFHPKIT